MSVASFARFKELREVDYASKLKEVIKENGAWIEGHACPCPRCHVVIDKNQVANNI